MENGVSASQSGIKNAVDTRLFIVSGPFQCTEAIPSIVVIVSQGHGK